MNNKNVRKGLGKIIFRILLIVFLIFGLIIVGVNMWMVNSTKEKVYPEVANIPTNNVALVLGTSKYSRSGRSNLFFKSRIEAAVKLYKAGKVKHFLLSGDNSLSYYNEPQDMKKALMAHGIPAAAITLDYAGFHTLDSVIRSKLIFKQNSITIITQEFHSYRALFISEFYGINAVVFTTDPVSGSYSIVTTLREYLARCKTIFQLYVQNKQPKFLGKEVDIFIE